MRRRRLGVGTKITPGGEGGQRFLVLMCYTPDFNDRTAVKSLLHSMEHELEGMGGDGDVKVQWGFKADVWSSLQILSNLGETTMQQASPAETLGHARAKKLGTAIYSAKEAKSDKFEQIQPEWQEELVKAPMALNAKKARTEGKAKARKEVPTKDYDF